MDPLRGTELREPRSVRLDALRARHTDSVALRARHLRFQRAQGAINRSCQQFARNLPRFVQIAKVICLSELSMNWFRAEAGTPPVARYQPFVSGNGGFGRDGFAAFRRLGRNRMRL
jgi:hypothetical protein